MPKRNLELDLKNLMIERGLDRRAALKTLGAMGLAPWMLRCGEERRPLNETIDTVVVFMMENRSFDHYLGALSLLEGRADIDGLTAGMTNPRRSGAPSPIHPADLNCIADPPHGWNPSRAQWGEGRNDGFVRAYAESHGDDGDHRPMGFFDRSMLPALYALTDEYAVCQRWFASVMGPTWPNRFYSHAADSLGQKSNSLADYNSLWTIYDRLHAAGRSWATYYGNLSFTLLFAKEYDHGPYRALDRFFDDAAAGTLPNVTLVEPLYGRNDDHPPAHPLAGQVLLSQVYRALAKSPQWGRSLLLLTYDEHGGFFDHVSPPKTTDARASDGFDQLGFRVPTVAAGPFVRPGFVSNTVLEHASIPAFIERLWDLKPLNARDAAANDFTEVLDLERVAEGAPRAPIELPLVEADEAEIYAPACRAQLPLVRTGGGLELGQPELEAFVAERFAGTPLDRRHETDRTFDALLRRAERDGILKLRG